MSHYQKTMDTESIEIPTPATVYVTQQVSRKKSDFDH